MRSWKKNLVLTLGCLQIASIVQAAVPNTTDANPYFAIVGHNSFGLVPPPSPTVQDANIPPPEITLNGITTIFGDKRALFKVRTQSPANEKSCMLSEGQRDGDIEMLSVDVKKNSITVNNQGVIQTIPICRTPVVLFMANASMQGGNGSLAANNNPRISNGPNQFPAPEFQNSDGQSVAFQSGYQAGGYQSGTDKSKTPSSADNGANDGGNKNSGVADANGSNSSAPKLEPWWVRGSKMVERTRMQSANAVLKGMADPQPLTPLTPPGTPAELIGSDQLYFDHM